MFVLVIAAGLATGQVYRMEMAPRGSQAAQGGPAIRYSMETLPPPSGPPSGDSGADYEITIEVAPDALPFRLERVPSSRARSRDDEAQDPPPAPLRPRGDAAERDRREKFPRMMAALDRERALKRSRGDYIMEEIDPAPRPYDPAPLDVIPPTPTYPIWNPAPILIPTYGPPCVGGQCGPAMPGFTYGAHRSGGFLGRVIGR